ncbi:gibberellin-regulated protein 14 [Cucumis melo var. makuwa]|uniref:Gibberellin-regulated protein 14 n=1 Tax=Cucumis melo var. makuwa TaxID=1194695 RepID=A0A5A7UD43_CUCMM|nr:gibberellin-regulated protein 14 [Cucumis melo var. makuwa]
MASMANLFVFSVFLLFGSWDAVYPHVPVPVPSPPVYKSPSPAPPVKPLPLPAPPVKPPTTPVLTPPPVKAPYTPAPPVKLPPPPYTPSPPVKAPYTPSPPVNPPSSSPPPAKAPYTPSPPVKPPYTPVPPVKPPSPAAPRPPPVIGKVNFSITLSNDSLLRALCLLPRMWKKMPTSFKEKDVPKGMRDMLLQVQVCSTSMQKRSTQAGNRPVFSRSLTDSKNQSTPKLVDPTLNPQTREEVVGKKQTLIIVPYRTTVLKAKFGATSVLNGKCNSSVHS